MANGLWKWACVIIIIAIVPAVSAHCPLCTIAAGTGVGVARAYGLDDSIAGLFIGALIASSALWFNKWFRKKMDIPLQEFLALFASFLLTAIPLYYSNIITNVNIVKLAPASSILFLGYLGMDRLFAGIIIGTLATWGTFTLSDYIRNRRKKVLWSYQGLSFMAIMLTALSMVLWVITK